MLYTLTSVRDNIRNRGGQRVFYLGKGDQLTSTARDYLARERIEVLPASQARPQRYRLLDGGFLEEKPEHMTHLHSDLLVPKTHPRILFRGKMDTLEAELLIAVTELPRWAEALGEVLELARKILRCDVLEEPLEMDLLCGLTAEELRSHSHFPQEYYGQPHFMPRPSDGITVLRLNKLRCAVRETELAAAAAWPPQNGKSTRPDIQTALNRMSSLVYILMIRERSMQESGKGCSHGQKNTGCSG